MRRCRNIYKHGSGIDKRFIATFVMGANETLTLPMIGTNNCTVDWGDNTPVQAVTTSNPTHTYAYTGVYQVIINGAMTKFVFDGYSTSNSKITSVTNIGTTGLTQLMFFNCKNLTSIVDDNYEGLELITMDYFLRDSINMSELRLPKFKATNVTNVNTAFANCGLTSVSLPMFNPINVTSLNSMFLNSNYLKTISLPAFEGINVTTMTSFIGSSYSANYCPLTTLQLPKFRGDSLTNMSFAFRGCRDLVTLDLPEFRGDNLSNIFAVCYDCGALKYINAPYFTGKSLQDGTYAFTLSSLNSDSYSTLLTQMASVAHTYTGITLHFGSSKYNDAGQTARNILTGTYGWTITDGGHI